MNASVAFQPIERPRSIAVFRALALGDLLNAVPFLRALRRANPAAHISLIGLPWARSFVSRFDAYLDELIEFQGYPGIPEVPLEAGRLVPFLGALQARHFDLAVQLQGSGLSSNAFTLLIDARETAGSYLPALGPPTVGRWVPYPAHAHEIHRQLAVLDALGLPAAGDYLEFPLTEQDARSLRVSIGDDRLEPGTYAVVHPGASIQARRWPAERFAVIADRLAQRELRVVLTGTTDEAATTAAVRSAMRRPALDLAGRTDLGAFGRLIADARVVVTNDTGTSHIAAAVTTPSVVIFLASDRARWAPLDATLHLAVGAGRTNACTDDARDEHRCLGDACARRHPVTAAIRDDVSIADVESAVERVLATTVGSLVGVGR